ncbi:MAG: hypothetical protein M3358_09960, partial [Actinomycetota bacterium]|nr:hypothetical protein [Actinomycetota bacterium]
MVELMNVHEQVDLDYARAHRRALVGGFLAWVRGRCASLRAFEEAHRELGAENRRHLGRRTVEVGRVVGSVGRWREFDAGFMPTRASAGRWKRVDLAYRTGRDLPPVALYKLGPRRSGWRGGVLVALASSAPSPSDGSPSAPQGGRQPLPDNPEWRGISTPISTQRWMGPARRRPITTGVVE